MENIKYKQGVTKDAEGQSSLNDRLCRYYVAPAPGCQCHRETCCCDDWAVYDRPRELLHTYFRQSDAQELADALNMRHNVI